MRTRFPSLTHTLRRLGHVLWWTVTLQVGYRYHMWREYRKALLGQPVGPVVELASPPHVSSTGDLKIAFNSMYDAWPIALPQAPNPIVSVVIPAFQGLEDLLSCLRSLSLTASSEPAFEVILVDDCPSAPVLQALPDSGGLKKVANNENIGFLHTCNRGAELAQGRYLCFLNSDTIVYPGWLRALVETVEASHEVGIAGGLLLNVDGTIQSAGWRMLANGWGYPIGSGKSPRDGAYTCRRTVDCVTGACFLIERELFLDLGKFDPMFAPAFYEEFDLAFRVRKRGLRVVVDPRSRVVHLGGGSYGLERRDELSAVNHAKFCKRHQEALRKQPWGFADEFSILEAPGRRPTILVVDDSLPQPDRHAGGVTMYSYLSLLAKADWRVIFAPMDGRAEGSWADALERQGVTLVRHPTTVQAWLRENGKHLDHVWLARPDLATEALPWVREYSSAPVAYYTHDLHHVRLQAEADLHDDRILRAEARRVKQVELGVFRSVDRITSPSAEEAVTIEELVPGKPITVLPPYFFESEEVLSYDSCHFEGLTDVVFVGGFPHLPNVDAAVFIASSVMPLVWKHRPDAHLLLVGYRPPKEVLTLAGARVVVTGQVPDIEPYLQRARVFLAALRYGAGVKGKIVEAFRHGVPVVSTPIGVEGIGITPDRQALVRDGPEGLAEAVLELLGSSQRCAELSAAGEALVRDRFTRTRARRALNEVFPVARCAVCGSSDLLDPRSWPDIRAAFVCKNCFALGRTEALAQVIVRQLALGGETSVLEMARTRPDLRIHEFGFVGGLADSLRPLPWFSCSEFFDDVARGEEDAAGVRCEDLQALTFPDDTFDLVISQDVFEHIPDPQQGFAEIARVLRRGGSHFFTVRISEGSPCSIARVSSVNGLLQHVLPPHWRGDPVRAEGALVCTDFGEDILELVGQAGFAVTRHKVMVLGGRHDQTVDVFQAVKL